MDENRYPDRHTCMGHPSNAGDDSSFSSYDDIPHPLPAPFFTETRKRKSQLGKHIRRNRVLQDLNQNPEYVKSNDCYQDVSKPVDLLAIDVTPAVTSTLDLTPEDSKSNSNLGPPTDHSNLLSSFYMTPDDSKSKSHHTSKYLPVKSICDPIPFILPDVPLNLSQTKPELVKLPSPDKIVQTASKESDNTNPNDEFKRPESPPPCKKDKDDFQFEPPLPVPLNPKSSDTLPPFITVKGKSYSVVNILGSGGSSMVYQVLHPENNETLAIKRVNLSEVDESIAEGYIDEVKLLKNLQKSEFIIKMYDHEIVCENNRKLLHVVMEKGDTDLSELIRNINKTKKLSILMILYYWHEMLSAVFEIHNSGIIHSDLKPANFLLVKGRLKLIDFGIASSIQGDMTSVYKDVFTGTLNYMSPEAVQYVNCSSGSIGYKITYKTDVWSLGCILYNLIYGRLPFQHLKRKFEKMRAIVDPKVQIEFPEIKGVPSVLMQALRSCLDKDPKKRMSVKELLQLPYCGN